MYYVTCGRWLFIIIKCFYFFRPLLEARVEIGKTMSFIFWRNWIQEKISIEISWPLEVSSTAISGVPSLISTDIFGLKKGLSFGVPGIIIIEGTWRLNGGWRTLKPRNFQPQSLTPEFSTPDFSTMNLSTQKIMNRVLKSPNLKVGVEKSGLNIKMTSLQTFQPWTFQHQTWMNWG